MSCRALGQQLPGSLLQASGSSRRAAWNTRDTCLGVAICKEHPWLSCTHLISLTLLQPQVSFILSRCTQAGYCKCTVAESAPASLCHSPQPSGSAACPGLQAGGKQLRSASLVDSKEVRRQGHSCEQSSWQELAAGAGHDTV